MIKYKVEVKGPLACHANDIHEDLQLHRYTELSIRNLMLVVADLSKWLKRKRLNLSKFDECEVNCFLLYRKRKFTGIITIGALSSLLRFFWKNKLIPKWKLKKRKPLTRLDRLIERYVRYLSSERGLGTSTICSRKKEAYDFLLKYTGKEAFLRRLKPKHIRSYILSKKESPHRTAAIHCSSGLRSLFRYLFIRNLIQKDLSLAIPSIAGWRLRTLPRSIDPVIIERLLESCDLSSSSGRRDYAILMILTQLGLRAGEVAALTLDSLSWRDGVIHISGKGNRVDSLPLPKKVGKAIAAYLRNGRYKTKSRRLFLKERAPIGPEIVTGNIRSTVKRACKRANVPEFALHRLRHTVATQILRRGGTLTEIGQVLRHRGVDTTAIYAKTDRIALQSIAKKWPGGVK